MLLEGGRRKTQGIQQRAKLVFLSVPWALSVTEMRNRDISIIRWSDGETEKESDNRHRPGLAVILGHHSNSDVWLVSGK